MGNVFSKGSHLPILAYAVRKTQGTVIECGVGYFSTPFLHYVCCPNRPVVSLEPDEKWANLFTGFACDGHRIERVASTVVGWIDALAAACNASHIGVALIDQDNDTFANRAATAGYLIDRADIVVIHDMKIDSGHHRRIPKRVRRAKFVRFFPDHGDKYCFGTIAASQRIDVHKWPELTFENA